MADFDNNCIAKESCFRYFARLETWTREEAAALLLGLDPRVALRIDGISHLRPVDRLQPYQDLLEMIIRAKTALPDGRSLKPALILNWTKLNGLNAPEALINEVHKADERIKTPEEVFPDTKELVLEIETSPEKKTVEEPPIHHKTKASLLKLIAGMAIRGYGYNPSRPKNQAITDIETDLQILNIPLSDDTIRRWIIEACELVDWEVVKPEADPR